MENDDDYLLFSHSEEPSSPIHKPKLKRLKRTSTLSSEPTAQFVDSSHANASCSTKDLHSEPLESTDFEKAVDSVEPMFESEGLVTVGDSVYDQDGMVSDQDQTRTADTLHVEKQAKLDDLNVANDDCDGKGANRSNDSSENGENLDDSEFANERQRSDGVETDEKKEKKRGKTDGEDGKPKASARTKKRMEKERKIHIERLHAETQRLLRETRDASFKPVSVVEKPISSVLEKIRKRKLEIAKKASISNSCPETDCTSRGGMLNVYHDHFGRNEQINDKSAEEMETDLIVANGNDNQLDGPFGRSGDPVSPSDQCENVSRSKALYEELVTFRNPIDDTQDIFNGSESFNEEDVPRDGPMEEEFAPSLLAMDLKFDSAPPEEIFSDEEDDDKENMDPQPHKMFNRDSSPNGDLVKAFLDDEAEEEDDSDDDPMCSQENEEDEENGESEEFNDLIVPAYKENQIDNEKRDQLHQKWLELQDAAATENVLQRIKCGLKQSEATMLEVEKDEDFDEESENEASADLLPKSVQRINSKKAKQMIPLMFSDKDDAFVSDDEETEQNLVRKRLLEKADEHVALLSPAEDESSREVFGLIKKVNVVPDTKKKAKSSSYFDKVISGENSNGSSKLSFLGRVTSNSLPASNKNGSSNVRSFIFGRDDSNSRSGISASEASLDVEERGNQPKRNASVKFTSSQFKKGSQSTGTSETSSDFSLLEILKRSTSKFDQKQDGVVGQTQAVIQFAAFKSRKKLIKMESRK